MVAIPPFHAFRLHPRQDLKLEIEQFVAQNKIRAGAIVTCVGSLKQASLRLADQPEASSYTAKLEIVSLAGTLSLEGCHLHIAVADSSGSVVGGHLMPGCIIYTTAEIVLLELPGLVFTRMPDAQTGFRELEILLKDE